MAIAVEPELDGPDVEREKAKVENAAIERKLIADRDKADKRGRLFGSVSSTLPFAFLILVWWGVEVIFDPPDTRLVPPQRVVTSFFEVVREGTLPAYISQSIGRLAFSGGIALLVGIPIGWILSLIHI